MFPGNSVLLLISKSYVMINTDDDDCNAWMKNLLKVTKKCHNLLAEHLPLFNYNVNEIQKWWICSTETKLKDQHLLYHVTGRCISLLSFLPMFL